jgi:NAD(P)-dependent dehydrogenase (short-subunit alcohol dehydrogenase family)
MQPESRWPSFFTGKTVFVTGGSSGINLGIAQAFASLGANVAICSRSQEKLDTALTLLRQRAPAGRILARVADVRIPQQLEAALAACQDELGLIDVLVCGAAGNFLAAADKLSPNGFRTVIDIDLIGSFNASRLAFEQLKATRGCLIFISAGMALVPHAYQAHVGAAKAGIDMMMRTLAIEWGPYGIRANSIIPGPIDGTEGVRRLVSPTSAKSLVEAIPLMRMGKIEDVANAAVFLASPLAAYITGAVLPVDGGQCLTGSRPFNEGAAQFLATQVTPTGGQRVSTAITF